jgi:hypothetical protein
VAEAHGVGMPAHLARLRLSRFYVTPLPVAHIGQPVTPDGDHVCRLGLAFIGAAPGTLMAQLRPIIMATICGCC